jgi:hypothetical protein
VLFDAKVGDYWSGSQSHQYDTRPLEVENKPPLFQVRTPAAGDLEYHSEDGKYGWIVQELVCPSEDDCWRVVDVVYESEGLLKYEREIRMFNKSSLMTAVQLR